MKNDSPVFDAAYVEELCSSLVAPDRATFLALCAPDLAAGYAAEVSEAARRLFGPMA